jgi:hypothetical protein
MVNKTFHDRNIDNCAAIDQDRPTVLSPRRFYVRHFMLGAAPAAITAALVIGTLTCGSMFRDTMLFRETQFAISGSEASIVLAVLIMVVAWPRIFGKPPSPVSTETPERGPQNKQNSAKGS